MSKNDGALLEKYVRECATENHWSLHRLYDTKSAGKFLPPQPADFIGVLQGVPVLLECKSSDQFKSFKECSLKSFIKPTQYASFTMWQRNGGCGLFVFYSIFGKTFEIWGSRDILRAYSDGWNPHMKPALSCNKKALAETILKYVTDWRNYDVS